MFTSPANRAICVIRMDREEFAGGPNCVQRNLKNLFASFYSVAKFGLNTMCAADIQKNPRWSKYHTVWAQGFSPQNSLFAVTPANFDG